ncbi:MTA70 family [Acanthamoeba castellanii str. Neff]|uniref:MTA70 family n=1 Tax=Acanthamoeba castellanii (strain ATCC 30010 / Neff) TaxID=1257118 RepID=L8HEG0_ACACF|nr:MTA70 family [Acanthamoeba castellanii str. Neff]ELR22796.1 MTA70 family [Acanthamoeba castellanii str. Neff]
MEEGTVPPARDDSRAPAAEAAPLVVVFVAGQQQQQKQEEEEEQEAGGEGEGEAEVAGGFGLVVVDPPWENRSLSRSHNYGTLAPHEIAKLPVRSLLSSAGAYVVVWVTNNPAIHNFVKRNLFPRWRVQYVATHYWLKLTSSGEPVMPLNSAHRKPYEELAGLRKEMVVCSVANRYARKPSLDAVAAAGCWLLARGC